MEEKFRRHSKDFDRKAENLLARLDVEKRILQLMEERKKIIKREPTNETVYGVGELNGRIDELNKVLDILESLGV